MKGCGEAGHACHMQWALPSAEVHGIAFRLDDPVMPADLTEVHKELLPTAHLGPSLAVDASSANPMLAPSSYPGCHKRSVRKPIQDYCTVGHLAFGYQFQGKVPLTASKLSFGTQEKLVPATSIHLQRVLTCQGEVGSIRSQHKDSYIHGLGGIGRELHEEHEAGLPDLHAAGSSSREVEIEASLVDAGEACEHKKPRQDSAA